MLAQAASETGGIAIQNRGTLGGNIANASPAADSPPALLAYGAAARAQLAAWGARRCRTRPSTPATSRRVAAPDEIVARIVVPRGAGRGRARVHYYRKVGPRRAQAISKVCFAACADRDGARVTAVRIALGGVAPMPVRAVEAERAIVAGEPVERVNEALARAIAPIDDVRSTRAYRRRVAGNLLRELPGSCGTGFVSSPSSRRAERPRPSSRSCAARGPRRRRRARRWSSSPTGRSSAPSAAVTSSSSSSPTRARCLAAGEPKIFRYPLGATAGQCCGGVVEMFVDVAGHGAAASTSSARATSRRRSAACSPARRSPFTPSTSARSGPAPCPPSVRRHAVPWDAFVAEAEWSAERTYVAIMTHRHDVDEAIVADVVARPARYLGLIGSETKWRRFRDRLESRGLGEGGARPRALPHRPRHRRQVAAGGRHQRRGGAARRAPWPARPLRSAVVVLAAGRSSRMGEPKGLVVVEGRTWIDRQLEALGRRRAVLVLGHDRERYLRPWSSLWAAAVRPRDQPRPGPRALLVPAGRARRRGPRAPRRSCCPSTFRPPGMPSGRPWRLPSARPRRPSPSTRERAGTRCSSAPPSSPVC